MPEIDTPIEPMSSNVSIIDTPYGQPLIIGSAVGVMLIVASLFKNS